MNVQQSVREVLLCQIVFLINRFEHNCLILHLTSVLKLT